MKPNMRVPILLACAALSLNGVHAEPLSAADRETLLDNLEKLKAAADSRVDARFKVALAAFRSAMSSDEAAVELYLNCMERVNFQEEQKKASDFREWKRKEAEKLNEPGLQVALRYQLRWLVLTLQAAEEKPDRDKLAVEAGQIVDAIFRDAEKFRGQVNILGQSVTSSVFARAYDINSVKVDNWPTSPIQLDAIYDNVILPPLRKPTRIPELKTQWIKRIQQETAKVEFWSKQGPREEKHLGPQQGDSADLIKFREETIPKMQWEMEMDLFRSGDESNAAVAMLGILEKNVGHPSAREWGEQFKALLAPAVVAPPAPPKIDWSKP